MDTNQQQPTGIDFNQEMDRIGYNPDFPPKTINGVPLTDNQHASYIALAGTASKSLINRLINSEGWSKVPDSSKLQIVKGIVQKARANAQSILMAQSLHRPDGLLQQSLAKQKTEGMESE